MSNPIQVRDGCLNLSDKIPSHIVLFDSEGRLAAFKPASVEDVEHNFHWKPEWFHVNGRRGTRMIIRVRRIDETHPVSLQPPSDPPDGGSVSVTLTGSNSAPAVSPMQATYTNDNGGM